MYGERCKFAHPADERVYGGAAAAAEEGGGDSPSFGGRVRRRVKKRGRCGLLRRFLLDVFGLDALRRGPVLDVGGGKGELSFELENLNDVRCVVVDPTTVRLSKLKHKLASGWYHRTLPLQGYNTAPTPPPVTRRRLGRTRRSKQGDEAEAPVEEKASEREKREEEEEEEEEEEADEDAGWTPRAPLHWRMLWCPDLWEATIGEEDLGVGRVALHRAWSAAQTVRFFESGSGVKRVGNGGVSGCGQNERRADEGDEGGGHDAASHLITRALRGLRLAARGEDASEREPARREEDDLNASERTRDVANGVTHCPADCEGDEDADEENGDGDFGTRGIRDDGEGEGECECDGCGGDFGVLGDDREDVQRRRQGTSEEREACDDAPPRLDVVRRALLGCSAVVGMHSDQATEWIVDFALKHDKAFAVVPCCVCPSVFPRRRTPAGGAVISHDDFVEYLVGKAEPGKIQVARLGFEGKDTVVYSTGSSAMNRN